MKYLPAFVTAFLSKYRKSIEDEGTCEELARRERRKVNFLWKNKKR
jgi:hypothetical protein